MIGTLRTVVLDAPDARRLAVFYTALGGWTEQYADDDWITMETGRVAHRRPAQPRPRTAAVARSGVPAAGAPRPARAGPRRWLGEGATTDATDG